MKQLITILDPTDTKRISEYYTQFYTQQYGNLDQMNQFFAKYKLSSKYN